MIRLAAKEILYLRPSVRCVGTFGCHSCQTLIFADPFALALFIIAQAHFVTLFRFEGRRQTDGQRLVQLSDGAVLPIPKSDVEGGAGQYLLIERVTDTIAIIGND